MATVFDVAAYILDKRGPMTAMKLQKLVYYSQAWHITWTDDALFENKIEAWKDGPVCPDLWHKHAYEFRVEAILGGDIEKLSKREKKSIDKVLKFYGNKSSQWLSDLTHLEDPWIKARAGTPSGERSNAVISRASMAQYYSSIK